MRTATPSHPSIVIFCTTLELENEPFSKLYYWEAYQDLLFALKDRGLEAYFATGQDSYLGAGQFKTVYTTDIKLDNPSGLKPVHNVHADLVFDRAESSPFAGRDIPVINPAGLREIANDKIAIYQHFPKLQPLSRPCGNLDELKAALEDLPGDNVVVKEPVSSGGRAVYIGPKAEVLRQIPDDQYPLLAQEFLDTAQGVPGQKSGVHDIRLSICGGRIIGYYIRIAQAGSYHSNVSRGGKMIFLPVSQVPAEVQQMVKEIDRRFASSPRYYAADFVHSDKGWKMIELNPYLALLPLYEGDEAVQTFTALADYLQQQCRANVHVAGHHRLMRTH
jgi:glutathione synthase/RimK-type ligase-like ATP-grasp enzyme